MNSAEALRAIRYDWLHYIQKTVRAEFDNDLQAPLNFTHEKVHRSIREVMGHFRIRVDGLRNGFLVKTDDEEVFFLYFHRPDEGRTIEEARWVLSFRVLNDNELMSLCREDRKMLVNMMVKRVVEFHGHLCPELAIGMKACEYASKLLVESEGKPVGRLSVIAENNTSALDAFQVLLGVTVGNQALSVMDFGKHNYTFSTVNTQKNFMLRLKRLEYGDESSYGILEQKVAENRITLDEVVEYQQLLDARVDKLLSSLPEELFDLDDANGLALRFEAPTTYVLCSSCGQQVLRERALKVRGNYYCNPCFKSLEAYDLNRKLH